MCKVTRRGEEKERQTDRVQMREVTGRALKTEERVEVCVHRVQLFRCYCGLKVAVCGWGPRMIKQIYCLFAVVQFGTGSDVWVTLLLSSRRWEDGQWTLLGADGASCTEGTPEHNIQEGCSCTVRDRTAVIDLNLGLWINVCDEKRRPRINYANQITCPGVWDSSYMDLIWPRGCEATMHIWAITLYKTSDETDRMGEWNIKQSDCLQKPSTFSFCLIWLIVKARAALLGK